MYRYRPIQNVHCTDMIQACKWYRQCLAWYINHTYGYNRVDTDSDTTCISNTFKYIKYIENTDKSPDTTCQSPRILKRKHMYLHVSCMPAYLCFISVLSVCIFNVFAYIACFCLYRTAWQVLRRKIHTHADRYMQTHKGYMHVFSLLISSVWILYLFVCFACTCLYQHAKKFVLVTYTCSIYLFLSVRIWVRYKRIKQVVSVCIMIVSLFISLSLCTNNIQEKCICFFISCMHR